jgi:hypothetical protein
MAFSYPFSITTILLGQKFKTRLRAWGVFSDITAPKRIPTLLSPTAATVGKEKPPLIHGYTPVPEIELARPLATRKIRKSGTAAQPATAAPVMAAQLSRHLSGANA